MLPGVEVPKRVALLSGEPRVKQLVRRAVIKSLRMRFWRKTPPLDISRLLRLSPETNCNELLLEGVIWGM